MKNKLNYLNPAYYLRRIKDYGFTMNALSFFLLNFIVVCISVVIGIYFMLGPLHIFILCLWTLACLPYTILSYFRNLYTKHKFYQLRQYLQYSYLHFGIVQSIPYTLKEVEKFVEGKVQNCINEARKRLIDYHGMDYYEYAFKPIEDEFLNSRVKTFHQFMKDVELKSSNHFQETLENIKYDFNRYVERTLLYQLELKMIKRNFKIAVLICLGISAILCSFYRNHPMLSTFTSHSIYQWVTLLYLIGLFFIFIMSEIKLHGRWLYEDLNYSKEDKYEKYVNYLRHYSSKNDKNKKILFFLFLCLTSAIYSFYPSLFLYVLLVVVGSLMIFNETFVYKKRKRIVARVIEKEFPNWLNSIALLLNDCIVPVAIKETQNPSLIMNSYIEDLVSEIEKDPKSITPYSYFLSEYHNDEITNSMKTLYSIQNQTENPASVILELIRQNQRMLRDSEKIRNEDYLAAIGFSIHSTTVLFMIKTSCDLFLLIISAIQVMRGMI